MKAVTTDTLDRRRVLQHLAAWIAGASLLSFSKISLAAATLQKSKAEWKQLLPKESYQVLFEEATEAPAAAP